jgi:hypothetical protein
MRIKLEQTDVANMSDAQLHEAVVGIREIAEQGETNPDFSAVMRALSDAFRAVYRERQQILQELGDDALDDGEEGECLGEDTR